MALTNTYKSTARTFDYETPTNKASPMIAYKVTATRDSISSKSVTLKLDFSVGWSNNKKGSLLKDPFKMKVEVGSTTLEVSVKIPKCNGTAGKLYDKNAWYHKWYYWFLGGICLIFPIFVMFLVFNF